MNAVRYGICALLLMMVPIATAAEAQPKPNEAFLWRMAVAEQAALEQSHSLLRSAPLDLYLGALIGRLWKFVESDLPPMTIRVIEDPEPDAVVYANGICYVTSGMLALLENEDQLAMIIAHELVHYTRRDSLAAFDLETALKTGKSPNGDHFTAEAEKRADLEGMGLMRQAGYCPQEILGLLGRVASTRKALVVPRGVAPMSFGERISGFEMSLEANALACKERAGQSIEFRIQTAPALLANASAAVQRGVWEAAAASIVGYLEIVTDSPQAHFLMGEVRLRKPERDLQGAIDAFETAIRLDQGFLPAYRALGVLHLKEGHLNIARQYFEHHLAIAPQAPENTYIKEYLLLCQN